MTESRPTRIALFGGSFDPPHMGHVMAALWAFCQVPLDAVWVLPVDRHPYADKSMTASWQQRWRLVEAAFAPLPFVELRDDERRNPTGTTFDLVSSLRAAHPHHHWFLITGSDTHADLENWYRGSELRQMVTPIAVPRGGCHGDGPALPAISSSHVRSRLAAGHDCADLLPYPVGDMIASEGWYRAAP